MHGQARDAPCNWLNKRLATTLCTQIGQCKQGKLFLTTSSDPAGDGLPGQALAPSLSLA